MTEEPTKSPWLDADEIKRQVSIEQVLAHYGLYERCKMRRSGKTLRGLSPFRDERNPSFSVNVEGNKWNDYPRPTIEGRECPGNVIGLVMAIENCGFRDALLKLSELAGLPAREPPGASEIRERVGAALRDPLPVNTGTGIYRPDAPAIINEIFGKELRGLRFDIPFLLERGLTPERARFYGVGYCSRGLMKGRIVVPIKNRAGEIAAYLGRSLKDDDPNGKWRFPLGFHKSLELYGAHRLARDEETREAVAKYGMIVTEGVFDTIALWEHGFKNAVSTLGSEVSKQQCALLVDPELNPSRRVIVFFDNDDAGRSGRKKLCGDIIHDAFVRYVDFGRIEAGDRTDPDEFTKDELLELLR